MTFGTPTIPRAAAMPTVRGQQPCRDPQYDDQHDNGRQYAQRVPPARGEERPAIHPGFAELNQRLDDLSRQLSQVASLSAAHAARPDPRNAPPPLHLVEVISKLDHST